MKVTALNPIYGTERIDESAEFFSKLGFNQAHRFKQEGFEICTLKNEESGLILDIMNSDYVREHNINGFFSCRLNVDDLQEAIDFFKDNGAEILTPVIKEGSSRELVNVKTSNGDLYSVIHHIK